MFSHVYKKISEPSLEVNERPEPVSDKEACLAFVPNTSGFTTAVATDVALYTLAFLQMAKNGADAASFVFACCGLTAPICGTGFVAGFVVSGLCKVGMFGKFSADEEIIKAYREQNKENEPSEITHIVEGNFNTRLSA
jgi:hypothetical protein